MRRLTVIAAALALAGCTLDLDRLRRGGDGGLDEDASIDGSIDASADAGADSGSDHDAGPPDGGCACIPTGGWVSERPGVAAGDILAVHTSDLDRDGAVDLIVTTSNTASQVLYGILPSCSAGGGFESAALITELPAGRIPAIVDRDGDEDDDVVVSDGASGVTFFEGETGFTRWTLLERETIPVGVASTRALVARLDFVGDPDVLIFGGGSLVQWMSVSERSVRPVATLTSEAVAAATTTESGGSGVITLAFVTAAESVEMIRTVSSGSFIVDGVLPLPEGARPTDVAFANIDSDADHELLVADAGSSAMLVFQPLGSGSYGDRTAFAVTDPPSAIAMADLDDDGLIELVVASRVSSTIRILDPRSGIEEAFVAGVPGPLDVVVTDLESDGRVDLVAGGGSGLGAQLTVLRARCEP